MISTLRHEEWLNGAQEEFQEKADNNEVWHILVKQVSMGHNNTGKSPHKCYSCTEEGMVQKRACKLKTCWVYKCTYHLCWNTTQCEDLTRIRLHAVTTTPKKAMPNTTLEQIQTLCGLQWLKYNCFAYPQRTIWDKWIRVPYEKQECVHGLKLAFDMRQ